jgi:hypothetical protein
MLQVISSLEPRFVLGWGRGEGGIGTGSKNTSYSSIFLDVFVWLGNADWKMRGNE